MLAHNRIALKIFLVLFLEIVFILPLSFLAGLLALAQLRAGLSNTLISVTTTTFLLMFSTYFAMLSLSRQFVLEDINPVSRWLATITLVWGFLSTLLHYSLLATIFNIIIYPALQYCISYLFLKHKFNKIDITT
jgi:hypothetical protein